jgi:hypothetical protein
MNLPSVSLPVALPRPSRRSVRVGSIALLLVGSLVLANGAVGGTSDPDPTPAVNSSVPYGYEVNIEPSINTSDPDTASIPDGAEVTVIANQGFFPDDENAELVAITRNGTLVYHNNSYGVYFDVDPVEGERHTVEYLASRQTTDCEEFDSTWCTVNVLERVNLSTGAVERLYAERTARVTGTRWHDADRINDTHVALADIARDSLRVINVSSGETTWEWNATAIYDFTGSQRPQDWTHVNDVEVLGNGTYMLSMRNMDEVVFVRRGEGAVGSRTLGTDGDHDVLYEQHNPDYIPEQRGGPAVLVADSENNRVVEYQRTDGEWVSAWTWKDPRLQWPRDADRLPNDRTLVVDSHGDRVLEVSPNGSVAWSVGVGMPYDVERLGTGDESAGGRATGAGNQGEVVNAGPVGQVVLFLKDVLPAKVVNGALFSTGAVGAEWMGFADLLVALVMLLTLLSWLVAEYRWAAWSVSGLARDAYRRVRGAG